MSGRLAALVLSLLFTHTLSKRITSHPEDSDSSAFDLVSSGDDSEDDSERDEMNSLTDRPHSPVYDESLLHPKNGELPHFIVPTDKSILDSSDIMAAIITGAVTGAILGVVAVGILIYRYMQKDRARYSQTNQS